MTGQFFFLSQLLVPVSSAAIDGLWWDPWVITAGLHLCAPSAPQPRLICFLAKQLKMQREGKGWSMIPGSHRGKGSGCPAIHLWPPAVHLSVHPHKHISSFFNLLSPTADLGINKCLSCYVCACGWQVKVVKLFVQACVYVPLWRLRPQCEAKHSHVLTHSYTHSMALST